MNDPFDWTQLTCPLPMLRVGWRDADDNESDELLRTLGPCGHPLHIYTTSVEYALAGGPSDGAHPWWKVKCEAGHVVFTYDDEGNDYDVPFVFEELQRALEMVGHPVFLIKDVDDEPPHVVMLMRNLEQSVAAAKAARQAQTAVDGDDYGEDPERDW